MNFEWDYSKAKVNIQKHRVTFDEAASVFEDPMAAIFPDEDHSANERRSIIVGYSLAYRLLLVSFTEREHDTLRIISARLATRKERRAHEAFCKR